MLKSEEISFVQFPGAGCMSARSFFNSYKLFWVIRKKKISRTQLLQSSYIPLRDTITG